MTWRPRCWSGKGLSPRVRGNRPRWWAAYQGRRSIPACAGEPAAAMGISSDQEVYPRVCGGTSYSPAPILNSKGLSPRVRGNRSRTRSPGLVQGSIPACAGEPLPYPLPDRQIEVYPRVCGGTNRSLRRRARRRGLSPRVRGNRIGVIAGPPDPGSIPACAGEPSRGWAPGSSGRVYPRVCGGTPAGADFRFGAGGLSPRVRGNP